MDWCGHVKQWQYHQASIRVDTTRSQRKMATQEQRDLEKEIWTAGFTYSCRNMKTELDKDKCSDKEYVKQERLQIIHHLIHTVDLVPLVDGEVIVACDGDNGRYRHGGMSVSSNMCHGRVWEELHDHTDIILDRREHHRRLNNSMQCTLTRLPTLRNQK